MMIDNIVVYSKKLVKFVKITSQYGKIRIHIHYSFLSSCFIYNPTKY